MLCWILRSVSQFSHSVVSDSPSDNFEPRQESQATASEKRRPRGGAEPAGQDPDVGAGMRATLSARSPLSLGLLGHRDAAAPATVAAPRAAVTWGGRAYLLFYLADIYKDYLSLLYKGIYFINSSEYCCQYQK